MQKKSLSEALSEQGPQKESHRLKIKKVVKFFLDFLWKKQIFKKFSVFKGKELC